MKLIFKMIIVFIFFNSTFEKKDFKSIEPNKESLIVKKFVDTQLSNKNGGIYTNYLDHTSEGDITKGHDVLSESQGLYMYYAVLTNDKTSFDKAFKFIKEKMVLKNGLISWRVGKKKSEISALIDDLKIIEALYNAYNLWGDQEYLYYLAQISYGVVEEYNELRNYSKGNNINLSYLNINGIKIIAMIYPEWNKQVKEAGRLLDKGYISDELPLYYEKYNFETKKYENLDMLQNVITHINSDDMKRKRKFLEWVDRNLSQNKEVLKINGVESTAVYSLVGQLAVETNNRKIADMMKKKIEKFQVKNNSDLTGGFGDVSTKEFYSFDNLTAMIFLGLGGY